MLCRDNEHHDSQMQAAITYGKLRQHCLRRIVFRHLNGVTATASGLKVGHAMGLRLRSRPAKASTSVQLGSRLPAKSSPLTLAARAMQGLHASEIGDVTGKDQGRLCLLC